MQKANVFRILLTRAQNAIDPEDWFVDKLNHGGILRRLGDRWCEDARNDGLAPEADWASAVFARGVVRAGLDTGHTRPPRVAPMAPLDPFATRFGESR